MFIATVPNRSSPPAILLRESYRENGKVKSRTLANLSKLPPQAIEALRRSLKGETLLPASEAFEIVDTVHHGHVRAVLQAMRRVSFADLIASRPSPQRDLVVAMVVAQVLNPSSKLATTRWWQLTSLPTLLGVEAADEDDLYDAMDWLLERQHSVQNKLAARHLEEQGLALYDLSSSYFEGVTCPLAARGHNRDGKKGKLQVNYGVLTNRAGTPVAVSVFEGNTNDSKTLLPAVNRVREQFAIERFVLVGDRGMIAQKQVDVLREIEGVEWIAALRPKAIDKLVDGGAIQIGLFDERNLFELTHPDFPGERLVACRNPELAKRRAKTRTSLLEATGKELEKVRQMVHRGHLRGKQAIDAQVTKVLGGYKVGKYYEIDVGQDGFEIKKVDAARMVAELEAASKTCEQVDKRLRRYCAHIEVIGKRIEKVRERIARGSLHGKDAIAVRVGKVVDKYKVGKHFRLDIGEDDFHFQVDQAKVDAEAALDGLYVVRTSLGHQQMSAPQAVRSYKLLSNVERAFRSLKTVHLRVRPIRHRLEDRVRAHIFVCMLAYYVEWHMLEAWRPLLFSDQDQQAKTSRDPVAPAKRSEEALRKVHSRKLEDGTEVHSFQTLLSLLSTITRNTCQVPGSGPQAPTFEVITTPNAKQQQAYDLLATISL